MNSLSSEYFVYLKLLRPWQWAKNLLILVPLILSSSLNLEKLYYSINLFLLFSLFVSGNYILNDLSDIDLDKNHPEKKYRPIASGKISTSLAKKISVFLFLFSAVVTYLYYDINILYLYFVYLGLALLYTKSLKFINFLDSIAISLLFLIRIAIGGMAANVNITIYLNIFIFLMSMFIVYLKKNSILNKQQLDNSIFHTILKNQDEKFSFYNILIFLGFSANISLLLWGVNLMKIISLNELITLVSYILIFIFITYRLIQNSKNAELEDFVFGIFKDKMLLLSFLVMLTLFIYFYF
jgi:4-hydroxybenzoate polyprenyltransferase